MIRKLAVTAIAVLGALTGPAATGSAAADDKPAEKIEIKLGTLAPKNSAWGGVFNAWAKAVKEETKGNVELSWFYNGSAGDEPGLIGDVISKKMHGGALTATGLSKIYPSVVALQMPGLVDTWAQLDAVRNAQKERFDKAFESQGFKILGWGDVGISHVMFRDPPKDPEHPDQGLKKPEIRTPADVKAYNTFYVAGDPIGSKFLEAIGIASPRALAVTAILPALSARDPAAIDIITAPAIAAEQLQWAPNVTHVIDLPVGFGIGALVIDKAFYEKLPEGVRKVLADTGKNTSELLTQRIRANDQAAWANLMKTKKVVTLNDAEKAQWRAKFADIRKVLKSEGKVKGDIWDEVVKSAGK